MFHFHSHKSTSCLRELDVLIYRPRNHNAVYVPNNKILDLLKREETVIVTQVGDDEPRAFPDSQILRPHVARVGTDKDGVPVTMTYCGLTNLVGDTKCVIDVPLIDSQLTLLGPLRAWRTRLLHIRTVSLWNWYRSHNLRTTWS